MHVGVCKVSLRLPENATLKGKRQILKSVIARIANKFSVSIAEVDGNDLWQRAELGISFVSNDSRHANEVLCRVMDFIVESRLDVEVLDYEIEILTV